MELAAIVLAILILVTVVLALKVPGGVYNQYRGLTQEEIDAEVSKWVSA